MTPAKAPATPTENELLRERLAERLDADAEYDLAAVLRSCGEELWLVCTNCGHSHAAQTRCKKRWCPVCVADQASALAAKYTLHVERMQWPLFVSGSCRNFRDLHVDPWHFILRAFYKLRKQRWFARAVTGGIVGTEITNTGRGWHPHWHAVIDCRWFAVETPAPAPSDGPQARARLYQRAGQECQAKWTLALGRPGSLKVKRAYAGAGRDSSPIAYEVLKYAVKGTDLVESIDPPGPIIRLMAGRRLARAWGSCYGQVTPEECQGDFTPRCPACKIAGSQVPEHVARAMCRTR